MKVVGVLGGLGSQMMKYAFYLKLKQELPNEDIYIDTTFFLQKQCWNGFELKKIFNIIEKDFVELYSPQEKKEILEDGICKKGYYEYAMSKMREEQGDATIYYINRGYKVIYFSSHKILKCFYNGITRIYKKLYYIYNRIFNLSYERYCENGIGNYFDRYTKGYASKKENIYYDEFNHISDQYFGDIRKKIQAVFKFPEFNENKNKEIKTDMENGNSVAVHIRMTDHLYDNEELIKRGYYKKSLTYIKNKVKRPVFYIFSDNYKWCKENLELLGFKKEDSLIFITWNQNENSYRDMQLMTYCKHNILAISSFSWWGYYLSRYEDKIVCAPKGYWLEVENHF